jgi:hypothetical protein
MYTLGFILAFIAVYGLHYWWAIWIAGMFVCWAVVIPWFFGPREYRGWLMELVLGVLWPIILVLGLLWWIVSFAINRWLACRDYFAGRRDRVIQCR